MGGGEKEQDFCFIFKALFIMKVGNYFESQGVKRVAGKLSWGNLGWLARMILVQRPVE